MVKLPSVPPKVIGPVMLLAEPPNEKAAPPPPVEERLIVPPPAAWVKAPFSAMSEPEITLMVPVPTFDVPKSVRVPFVKEIAPEPLLESEIAPTNSFVWVSVMGLAPTVKEEVLFTLRMPF